MSKLISEIIAEKSGPTISYEFFTPKTEQGQINLQQAAQQLYNETSPDFFSVTYGAGGSSRDTTTGLVRELQQRFELPVMHHLTCIGHSREELQAILNSLETNDIHNILALRGDPPLGQKDWHPHPEGFHYASQLCELISSQSVSYSIGVAAFPDIHPESPDMNSDIHYLGVKQKAGAEFAITQLFFDIGQFFRYRDAVESAGVDIPVIPGILPITNYRNLLKFTAGCGAKVTDEVHELFSPLEEDPETTMRLGIEYAVEQCSRLLDAGVPGLHFYTLNRAKPVLEIVQELGLD